MSTDTKAMSVSKTRSLLGETSSMSTRSVRCHDIHEPGSGVIHGMVQEVGSVAVFIPSSTNAWSRYAGITTNRDATAVNRSAQASSGQWRFTYGAMDVPRIVLSIYDESLECPG